MNLTRSTNLESDLLASQLAIDSPERIDLVVDSGELLGVKVNLVKTVTTDLVTATLANNVGRVNNVLKDSIVNGSKSAASGTPLVLLSTFAARLGEDAALTKENMHF